MFEKFDEYLSGFFTEDYWYDEGVIIAQELLQEFDDNDFNMLISSILLKPKVWQKRYVYCIDNDTVNSSIIKSILLLLSIDDDELFEECIDSLRVILNNDNVEMFLEGEVFSKTLERINKYNNKITKKTFSDFIKRLEELTNLSF